MRAVVLNRFDQPASLAAIAVPAAPPGHVRVKIMAAGLNKVDVNISAGSLRVDS